MAPVNNVAKILFCNSAPFLTWQRYFFAGGSLLLDLLDAYAAVWPYLFIGLCSFEQKTLFQQIFIERNGGAVHHCLCLWLLQLHWWYLRDDRLKGFALQMRFLLHFHTFALNLEQCALNLNCTDNLQAEEADDGFLLRSLANRHRSHPHRILGPV